MNDRKSHPFISRRQLLRTAAGSVALAAPALIFPNRARAADSLVFVGYGGTTQQLQEQVYVKPFMKETGIQVVSATGVDLARLRAMVTTGNLEWDVVNFAGVAGYSAGNAGLLEPLDYSVIDTSDMLLKPTSSVVPLYSYFAGIAYNPTKTPAGKYPTSYAEFWDVQKFPGKRSLRSDPNEILELALMADGVAPKDLYPLDVDRAFKSLDRIKPHVLKWGNSQDAITLLQRNEVAFSYAFGGRVFAMKSQGVPMDIHKKANVITPGVLTIPKGSKKRDLAMKFIAYWMRPEKQAEYCAVQGGYSPSKRAALPLLTPEARDMQPDVDDPATIVTDLQYWADNYEKIGIRYREWLLT